MVKYNEKSKAFILVITSSVFSYTEYLENVHKYVVSVTDASMSHYAKLRHILQDHNTGQLNLPPRILKSVAQLESFAKETFLFQNIALHYKDADFGEQYFSLSSTSDIKNKGHI